jgi:hypothetical protein
MSAIAVQAGAPRAEGRADDLVAAAAAYLGLSPAALEARLEAGWSMGEMACLRGRSIDGLFDVLLARCERDLAELPQETQLRAVEGIIVTERAPAPSLGGARR